MWRKLPKLLHFRPFSFSFSFSSSSSGEIPSLYSFLQPSIFALRKAPPPPNPPPKPPPPSPSPSALESALHSSLLSLHTDQAWSSFKSLTSLSRLPPPHLSNPLISHLSSLPSTPLNLKRAFAASVLLLRKSPRSLSSQTLHSLFQAFSSADAAAPALALLRTAFKNRCFPPFPVWGPSLIRTARRNNQGFAPFLKVFEENCRIALEEGIDSMRPDVESCNQVLDGCCRDLGSVSDAEKVVEIMSNLGLPPDGRRFGSLAYLYASKGMESRIGEVDQLIDALGLLDKSLFFRNLISGYVKTGKFESVNSVVLRALKSGEGADVLEDGNYAEIVRGFVESGRVKDLANLIIETQELESSTEVDNSVGFRIVNACVGLGMLDTAHRILDEMNARGASVGIGVYSSILKAYCKEQRTAEAAQLVTEISAAGLQLDPGSYDALIDASMSAQDFQSAFSLFRDMREARLPDLKTSYLTIMTGLTENHRPELMAAFLDSVVDDPRIEIATHDWNSIIHAFCKVGRLEDARRTYQRMVFLSFEPNNQTYLSLINGYAALEKYFSVLILWTDVRKKGIAFDHDVVDAFLYALVKGGFFDAAMQVVEKAQEMKIYVDKWRHKQAFMENHKKLKGSKFRRRNFRKMEALIAFKNWAGLNS